MAEYIEREKAVNAVRNVYLGVQGVQAINRIKAADVSPVRHGRWDKNGRCTVCGGHAPFWCMASTYYESPYCFECGARMDLVGDDNG